MDNVDLEAHRKAGQFQIQPKEPVPPSEQYSDGRTFNVNTLQDGWDGILEEVETNQCMLGPAGRLNEPKRLEEIATSLSERVKQKKRLLGLEMNDG